MLQYLNREINEHAVTDLIARVKEQHKHDDFSFDDRLQIYSNLPSLRVHRNWATYLKGIFKANRCRLEVSIDNHFHGRTAKISDGILREIYLAQSAQKRLLIDWQAYAGERVRCLCKNVSRTQIELYNDKAAIIHIEAQQTKARYNHICIVPRPIAERVLERMHDTGAVSPFPSHERLWREITQFAQIRYGVRLTSHYLRKRFHSIAQRTAMPVNDWDFLMGDRMSAGHEANTYTLEDWTQLVSEYSRFLEPFLSIADPIDPLDSAPSKSQFQTLEKLTLENAQLKEQIVKLTDVLTKKFS